ncbi:hypothetical protein ACA910_000767 [Epithemia clementina (nom. ined.)]
MTSTLLLLFISSVINANAFLTATSSGWAKPKETLSRHSYANTIDPPPVSDQEAGNSFDKQLRALSGLQTQQKRLNKPKQPHRIPGVGRRPAFLKHVSTLMDYKLHVAEEKERISVVRFISPSCRACKAATPLFDMLAHQFPDLNWAEVPVTKQNSALHQGLGVTTVPSGHIYVPGAGLVEELRMKQVFTSPLILTRTRLEYPWA